MDVAQARADQDRIQRAHRLAAEKFQREPDWVTFYREVLGVEGMVDDLFPTFDQRCEFEKTEEFAEIQQMLAKLRERSRGQKQPDEPTRVITVRLPQSLHEALRNEAHNHKTSMNKLCISKLLQVIADELVPSDFHRREEESTEPPLQELRPPVSQPSAPATPTYTPSTPSLQPPFGTTPPDARPF
jgi:predicted HicB family RNase H-like nuclease